jgi:ubiquinone/menaquinone biosynthesis C-methylase UbiE
MTQNTTPHGTKTDAKSQESLATGQFGPQAAAYVASPVHAQGEDLKQLAGLVAGRAGIRVLDLGCGGGHVAYAVAPHVKEVVACDLSTEMIAAVAAEAKQRGLANVGVQQGTAEKLPFADESFDAVFTRFSAHHWRDVPAALKEAKRVVKNDGFAAVVDAVSPGVPVLDTYLQGIELMRDPSHVRDYSVEEWKAMLRGAGFRPGAVTMRRLPLDFASWIARMRVAPAMAQSIRAVQSAMSADVVRHFDIKDDGAFTIDVATIEAEPV